MSVLRGPALCRGVHKVRRGLHSTCLVDIIAPGRWHLSFYIIVHCATPKAMLKAPSVSAGVGAAGPPRSRAGTSLPCRRAATRFVPPPIRLPSLQQPRTRLACAPCRHTIASPSARPCRHACSRRAHSAGRSRPCLVCSSSSSTTTKSGGAAQQGKRADDAGARAASPTPRAASPTPPPVPRASQVRTQPPSLPSST